MCLNGLKADLTVLRLMWFYSWFHDVDQVNVNRESACGAQRADSGQMWQAAFSQVKSHQHKPNATDHIG